MRRAAAIVGTAVLAVLAFRADRAAFAGAPWLIALDLLVAGAFVGAAAVADGPRAQRWLVAAVGPAWLLGSVFPAALVVHQAALAIALLAFPRGRLRGVVRWAAAAGAVVAAAAMVPRPGSAGLFLLVALVALPRVYPAAAAIVLAAVLGGAALTERFRDGYDPTTALVAYEIALIAVAAGFPLAARAVARGRARLADRVLADRRLTGLDGLATVLGGALGDPTLRVDRGVGPPGAGRLVVDGPDGPIATISGRPSILDDPPTAAAATAVVRLAVTNQLLLEEQQNRLAELEASRARLVAAADRQRALAASELQAGVDEPLRLARREVAAVRAGVHDGAAGAALDIVVAELDAAAREVADLVAGAPPAGLGDGRLDTALADLAGRCPLPVTVNVAPDATGDRGAETALYYVVSEALANAVKHARATTVGVAVRRAGPTLVATVQDDGVGGADADGSGLLGLADRLATHGGRLRVESPPGAGTRLIASVRRSDATVR